MGNRLFVRIHISETLFTTAPYDDVFWDSKYIYIEIPSGVKTYDRAKILSMEIFEG